MILQLVTAFIGSLGFAIVMKIKMPHTIYAAIAGSFTWFVYLEAYIALESYFLANFFAAVFVAVFAEIMARITKTPTTIFLTAVAIPLIPGGRLYYSMQGLINENREVFVENGTTAITIALAISVGFMAVTVLMKFINRLLGIQKKRFRGRKMIEDTKNLNTK